MKSNKINSIFAENNAQALVGELKLINGQDYKVGLHTQDKNVNMEFSCDEELIELHNDKIVKAENMSIETLLKFLPVVSQRINKTKEMMGLFEFIEA